MNPSQLVRIDSINNRTYGSYIEYTIVNLFFPDVKAEKERTASDFANFYTDKIDCSLFKEGYNRANEASNNKDLRDQIGNIQDRIDKIQQRVELLERKKK